MCGGVVGNLFGLMAKGIKLADEHSPAILTGLAVGGVIATVYLTAKATPKALKAIEEEKEYLERKAEEEDTEVKPLTKADIFKVGFKYYIPPILTAGATIACIIGAQHINSVRQAAMAASYEILRTSFDEYRYHVREELGKSKTEKIEHDIHKEKAEKILRENPLTESDYQKLDVEAGAAVFCDGVTGRRFVSTYEKVYRAVDEVNDRLSSDSGGGGEDWISINEFLSMCGDEDNDSGHGLSDLGLCPRIFERRLDRKTICDPIVGEHKGHVCTIVYLNYEEDNRRFLR